MTWIRVAGADKRHSVRIYTINHCTPCTKARTFFERNSIEYEYLNIDRADPEERKEAMIEIGEYLPARGVTIAYPIIIVDELSAVIGFESKYWKKNSTFLRSYRRYHFSC
jgi:glutaredoxin